MAADGDVSGTMWIYRIALDAADSGGWYRLERLAYSR